MISFQQPSKQAPKRFFVYFVVIIAIATSCAEPANHSRNPDRDWFVGTWTVNKDATVKAMTARILDKTLPIEGRTSGEPPITPEEANKAARVMADAMLSGPNVAMELKNSGVAVSQVFPDSEAMFWKLSQSEVLVENRNNPEDDEGVFHVYSYKPRCLEAFWPVQNSPGKYMPTGIIYLRSTGN